MSNKAIFFDRDGVVNVKLDNDYVKTIDEFVFCDNFFALFQYLKQQQYLLVLVTNQQCIGKEIITEHDLLTIHNYMDEQIYQATKFKFDAIYFCPDLDKTGSPNRKPATGMFDSAIQKFDIDASSSWTIGDSITDIIAGKAVGTQTILVNNQLQNLVDLTVQQPDFIMKNLADVLQHFHAISNDSNFSL